MKNVFFIYIFILVYSFQVRSQIVFDSSFENGRLDTSYYDNGSFTIAPITNLHFRITNALNQTPQFKIYDSLGYQLRPYHYMVYRYEDDSCWCFFDTAYKNTSIDYYHFTNFTPFVEDTVYIAYWFPYTYSDLRHYLTSISGNPYIVNSGIKGTSYGGRNLYGYEITDTNYTECYKSNVVITARQHPVESINGYFIEGATNYLIYSTDSMANALRRNYHFFIYPMLNPDGVYLGSGQNLLGQGLNREWEDSLFLGGTPEIDTIRPVIWNETNQKVDWSIDIHANAGSNIPYYWWGYTQSSGMPQWQVTAALNYVQSVSSFDTSSTINSSSYQNTIQGNGVSNSKTAANWFRKSFNSIAFTFEPTSEPMGSTGNNKYTIDQLKEAGQSLSLGFYTVHDTVESFGGEIIDTNNILFANVSGGHPPYTYNWSGPVNGNSDTLIATFSGIYTIEVTDSLGCSWKQSISHKVMSISTISQSKCNVYPNPATDYINIECQSSSSFAVVDIYNMLGQLWSSEIVYFNSPVRIRLKPCLSGFYVIKIRTKEGFFIRRIQILH